jgi:hypothetical protein
MDTTLKSIVKWIRAVGPYLLIELVMPGGTLLAILYWLSSHRRGRSEAL